MAPNAGCLLGISEGFLTVWVLKNLRTIALIVGEGRKRKERDGEVVGAFMGQEIAVMRAAKPRHQLEPKPRILLELGFLRGIDFVANIAGDHGLAFQLTAPA